jgi:phenylacetate-coenzyme A ligase PaaK-like adenylate-forming protein
MKKSKAPNIFENTNFEDLCFEVFHYQYFNCKVYRTFCNYFITSPDTVNNIIEIPFLPIEFFKNHKIVSNTNTIEKIFSSSGTTGQNVSKHYITDLELYKKNAEVIFEKLYGSIKDYCIIALLPSYLEREGSSLVYMVDHFINKSGHELSGFYLNNHRELYDRLIHLEKNKQKTLLIGVSFGLLDFIEKYNMTLNHTIVMETGGMKGRRKEMIREELHDRLKKGFGVNAIHSEYGMTELLSQAYSLGDEIYNLPESMQIFIRDPEDPLTIFSEYGKTGGINVIDLANINSCSFIATQDLGKKINDKTVKILGRFDNSDIRGCNLLTLN